MTSGVRARDASGQAADQRDELTTFQLTEMHPIPSRAGSTSQDTGLQRISQRDTRAIGEPQGRLAVAFPLGIALQHPSHPFGNDRFRMAAIAATAVVYRLRIVAESDDRSVANRR